MSALQTRARGLVRRSGFDVVRFRGDLARHQHHLLRSRGIDTVVDVGANEGQYAARLRLLGYRRRIVSFEPLPDAAAVLRSQADLDPCWTTHQVAVGAAETMAALHISANSVSSSLLEMTERHTTAEPRSAYVGALDVPVRPLDDYASCLPGRLWLKIDVQGGELGVLDGARTVLERTVVVQAELSLREVYCGGPPALQVIERLASEGFDLIDVERGFTEGATGALLQVDGLFARPLGADG